MAATSAAACTSRRWRSPTTGASRWCRWTRPDKLAFAAFSRRIYEGKHLSAPGVQHFGCDRIAIDLENERARRVFLLDVDGEPLGGLPLEVELVPRALTLRG